MKKNLLLRLCLVLFAIFYLQSCRNDYFEQNNHDASKKTNYLKLVKLSQIPHIAAFVKKESGRNDLSLSLKEVSSSGVQSKSTDISTLQVETQTIVAVGRNNATYYVFRISGADSRNNTTFYNLEVKESNGTPVNARIIEYMSAVSFSEEPLLDIQNFSGTVTVYSLNGEQESRFSLDDGTGECPPTSNNPPEDGGGANNEPIDTNPTYPGIPGEWGPGNGNPGSGGGDGNSPSNPDDCWQIVRVPTQPWRTLGWYNACTGERIDNPEEDGNYGNIEGMGTGILNSGCGDGSGTVIIPAEDEEECEKLKNSLDKAKDLIDIPVVKNQNNVLKATIVTDPFEKAFYFGKNSSGAQKVSSIVEGSPNSTGLAVSNAQFNPEGIIHNHNGTAGYMVFSPGDISAFHAYHNGFATLNHYYVNGGDGSMYVMTIQNQQAYNDYILQHSNSIDIASPSNPDGTGDWKNNSDLYKDRQELMDYFEKQGKTADEAMDLAVAYITGKYNMGIIISKKGTDGKFHPVQVESTITIDTATGQAKISYNQINPCNL